MASSSIPDLISWYSGPTLLATIGMNTREYSVNERVSVRDESIIPPFYVFKHFSMLPLDYPVHEQMTKGECN